jgi:hypothetical protein
MLFFYLLSTLLGNALGVDPEELACHVLLQSINFSLIAPVGVQ